MRAMVIVALALSLCRCAAVEETVQAYQDPSVEKFEVKNVDTFRIADDVSERRVVIRTSPFRIASAELNDIFTFGLTHYDTPETLMKSTALSYLLSTGRQCSIDGEKELSRMRWEFQYRCRVMQLEPSGRH